MTWLVNEASEFADEALEGFVAANSDCVKSVHGGLIRATSSPGGEVAVVLGGGSGHYPAFAGWVGPGFAHGAACGHIFASPSASQIYSVAKAADNGGGVILGFGNYAGDVLHFGQAAQQLRAEGIDVRIIAITDDIASSPPIDPSKRRGVAGDLNVFKIICAAAEAGLDIDAVESIGRRANEATRTLGVAFTGCTLPGATRPLFTVLERSVALGLGIHGEPGIRELALPTADELATLLVEAVLAEEPKRAAEGYQGHVAVLLNGLGAVKYEELFVTYRKVAELITAAGLTIVAPEVGEHVTSLDMAGVSLTLTFLDPETEMYWNAPASTPAFCRGRLDGRPLRTDDNSSRARLDITAGTPASRTAAQIAVRALGEVRDVLIENESRLGDIDAVAGDGDHGNGMARGSRAAAETASSAADKGAGIGTALALAGESWSERGGGTSGALWGAALCAFGRELGDRKPVSAQDLVAAARAGVNAITSLGGAKVGDKTLVDAAIPFVDALGKYDGDEGDLAALVANAAAVCESAAERTADIPARLGRARTHGDRSLGTPDAGAVSFALIVTRLAQVFTSPPHSVGTTTKEED
jgi:dihydroxyacetone kinase